MHVRATARAHANIALAKYWGKADPEQNLPAVPSVSVTLDALSTQTEVQFDDALEADELTLDAVRVQGRGLKRAARLLDEVRAMAGSKSFARITSHNSFPTGSGLASSASGFAALALASMAAAGLPIDRAMASDMARRASASAARSIFGGFVRLEAGAPGQRTLAASPIAPAGHWDIRVVVAVTSLGPKRVGSTEGMRHTASTSPYYGPWIEMSRGLADRVQKAILDRNLVALGEAAEHSALSMHACAMASQPPLVYLEPATLACVEAVRRLREQGVQAWVTIDAGPHVKVLTSPEQAARVAEHLASVPGVLRTIESRVGQDASVEVTEA
ncbi:MAG: diphosphomevalonate decarboxylase [Deltaproteobacteria bacterium]|nr:diphosphomevalonate decarboxylase [Deltaproteobacteria bacterium]